MALCSKKNRQLERLNYIQAKTIRKYASRKKIYYYQCKTKTKTAIQSWQVTYINYSVLEENYEII